MPQLTKYRLSDPSRSAPPTTRCHTFRARATAAQARIGIA